MGIVAVSNNHFPETENQEGSDASHQSQTNYLIRFQHKFQVWLHYHRIFWNSVKEKGNSCLFAEFEQVQ